MKITITDIGYVGPFKAIFLQQINEVEGLDIISEIRLKNGQ